MFESRVVEVAGVFAGAAITAAGKFRFVAVDPRVEDLDGSEWPSLAEVERVVGRLLRRNGHLRQDTVLPGDVLRPLVPGA
jgi:hypothetical protein